jgi:ABC-type transport system involved in multi-copper enzyme maturation permease subunit
MSAGNDALHDRRRVREPNPLLVKELRGRMRGARAFIVLTVYVLLLSCLASIIYYAFSVQAATLGGPNTAELGTAVFSSIVLIELFLVTFITPAFTAGAITGERDRKTFELLRSTLLPARKVVLGKLTAALTYVGLLVLATVPLEGLAFMLGGVVLEELLVALLILLVTAFAFGVVGLFFSSLVRRTLAATLLTYGTSLLMTVVLPVILFFVFLLIGEPIVSGYAAVQASVLVQAVLFYTIYFLGSLSPLTAAVISKVILVEESSLWYFDMTLSSSSATGTSSTIPVPSGWIVYVTSYLILSLVLLGLTVLRVKRQEIQ